MILVCYGLFVAGKHSRELNCIVDDDDVST
jgi:hypothetical protein